MSENFTNNVRSLNQSLENGLPILKKENVSHENKSQLKNYKVTEELWSHEFRSEWTENYEKAILKITVSYSEDSIFEVFIKISGFAGKNVELKSSKYIPPSEIINIGISEYILKLISEAKDEINSYI